MRHRHTSMRLLYTSIHHIYVTNTRALTVNFCFRAPSSDHHKSGPTLLSLGSVGEWYTWIHFLPSHFPAHKTAPFLPGLSLGGPPRAVVSWHWPLLQPRLMHALCAASRMSGLLCVNVECIMYKLHSMQISIVWHDMWMRYEAGDCHFDQHKKASN